jgi:shikimate dehydrogenase
MSKPAIGRDTRLCMSLSARPGNFGSRFQNHLYEALSLDYVYKAFSTRDLAAAIGGIRALNIRGCAISMPFKEACIALIDELAPSAAAIESVNTIVNDDGHLRGYNTDYVAIVKLIESNAISPQTSLVLCGSGGMAKAVASAFRDAGFKDGVIVARNEIAGRRLAEVCGYRWQSELGDLRPQMLINVTPIGMTGGAESEDLAFPESAIDAADIAFDVVAIPAETPFIRAARSRGKRIISGADVIVLQAVEQFVLYTGVTPSEAQVRAAAEFARE